MDRPKAPISKWTAAWALQFNMLIYITYGGCIVEGSFARNQVNK